jgi:hypothetical protein
MAPIATTALTAIVLTKLPPRFVFGIYPKCCLFRWGCTIWHAKNPVRIAV